jgi:hypothetical protein
LAEYEKLQKELNEGKVALNQRKLKIFNNMLVDQVRYG